jgi:succinate-acetate transporter protein
LFWQQSFQLPLAVAMNKREMVRFIAVTLFGYGLFALVLFLATLEFG